MKTNKKTSTGIGILIALVLFSSYVCAFGVSHPYIGEEKNLYLLPGDTTDFVFTLQSRKEPTNIKVVISEGSEVLQLADQKDTYLVSPGEHVKVPTKIAVPSSVEMGTIYPIKLSFFTIAEKAKGEFGLASSIGQGFSIIVGEAPEEGVEESIQKTNLWVFYIIGIVILSLVIFFIIRKRRQQTQLTK